MAQTAELRLLPGTRDGAGVVAKFFRAIGSSKERPRGQPSADCSAPVADVVPAVTGDGRQERSCE